MEENSEQLFDFNIRFLLKFIYKQKKLLVVLIVVSFVLFTVYSLLITPKYKSSAIIFPTASASVSNTLLGTNLAKKELLTFGQEEEVEQMIQVLQSAEIKSRIIRKYNLMEHYNIGNSKYPLTRLEDNYMANISFIRTPYYSIEIEVYDKDPQIAANIANDITALVDTTINNMLRERAVKAFKLVENEFTALRARKQALQDSLKVIQKKGVYHYEYQSQALNEALGKALADGKTAGAEMIEKKLKILAEYGGEYVSIRDLLERETEKLSILETKFVEAKMDVEQNLPHKFIVSKAIKAERKSYPVEWLIILLGTVSSFIFGLFILIVFDKFRKKLN